MQKDRAIFGGGCFWCTEAVYRSLRGVLDVKPGYSGGTTPNPNYESVCSGRTGHAEVIEIEYNPEEIRYQDLLKVFFGTHDPTTLNQQGNDIGTQYRSIILYTSEEQKTLGEESIKAAQEDITEPIVTELKAFEKFYEAEDYHKNYYAKNVLQPYCQVVISPKLSKLREKFKELLVEKNH